MRAAAHAWSDVAHGVRRGDQDESARRHALPSTPHRVPPLLQRERSGWLRVRRTRLAQPDAWDAVPCTRDAVSRRALRDPLCLHDEPSIRHGEPSRPERDPRNPLRDPRTCRLVLTTFYRDPSPWHALPGLSLRGLWARLGLPSPYRVAR